MLVAIKVWNDNTPATRITGTRLWLDSAAHCLRRAGYQVADSHCDPEVLRATRSREENDRVNMLLDLID